MLMATQGSFSKHGGFYQQRVHDREKTGALEIIAFQRGVVGKKEVDFGVNVRRPGSRGDRRVDNAVRQQVKLFLLFRNNLYFQPGGRLPIADAGYAIGYPGHRFRIEAVFVFEQSSGPNGGGRQPVLHADALAVQIARRTDTGALVDIDIRVAKHPFDENGNRRVAKRFIVQVGDVRAV